MEETLAILAVFGGGTCVLLAFSPIGRALADRIRGRVGVDAEALRAELAEQRDTVLSELDHVRREMAELAERLDFAERLLAKQRESERLPAGPRVGQGGA